MDEPKPFENGKSLSQHYGSAPEGVVSATGLGDAMLEIAKLQAEQTLGGAGEDPRFLGGVGFAARTVQQLASNAIAAAPGLGVDIKSPQCAGMVASVLMGWAAAVCEGLDGKIVEMPKDLHVLGWSGVEVPHD